MVGFTRCFWSIWSQLLGNKELIFSIVSFHEILLHKTQKQKPKKYNWILTFQSPFYSSHFLSLLISLWNTWWNPPDFPEFQIPNSSISELYLWSLSSTKNLSFLVDLWKSYCDKKYIVLGKKMNFYHSQLLKILNHNAYNRHAKACLKPRVKGFLITKNLETFREISISTY